MLGTPGFTVGAVGLIPGGETKDPTDPSAATTND